MVKRFFEKVRKTFSGSHEPDIDEVEDEYVELDTVSAIEEKRGKVIIRPFVINDFSDVKPVIDSLRVGTTVCLVNIKPLKNKDLIELKRAINKLKKTCDAIEGDIAGFGDDYIVVSPGFARIYRSKETEQIKEE